MKASKSRSAPNEAAVRMVEYDAERLHSEPTGTIVCFSTAKEERVLIPSEEEAFFLSEIATFESEGGKTLPDHGA